jgi:hypothetical protein
MKKRGNKFGRKKTKKELGREKGKEERRGKERNRRRSKHDVSYIKSGAFEGMLKIRKGANPRKNGKARVYLMLLSNSEYKDAAKSWQKFIKFNKDKTYNVIMKTEKINRKD